MAPTSVKVRSYAKINWTLEVLHLREDGYHEIRTIYQTVSLHDLLHVRASRRGVTVHCDDGLVPRDETNLAHKAAVLLKELTGRKSGVTIDIEKRIPVAGGLAGGSSNAAATLMGLVRLWGLQVPDRDLLSLAAKIGSDVPFFLTGGTALGVGRGEEVYPLGEVSSSRLLLANPGIAVSTPGAYKALGRLTTSSRAIIMPFTVLAAKGISELPLAARNDLEEVVLAVHPEIEGLKLRLIGFGANQALMSGSGATVFGVFDNKRDLSRALGAIRSADYWCEAVRTVDRREYFGTLFE